MNESRSLLDFGREPTLSRRDFVRGVGVSALAAGLPLVPGTRALGALQESGTGSLVDPAETAVGRLYQSLTDAQRKDLCFGFADPKRSEVQNNWAIVPQKIADLTTEQQAFCREVMKGLCSEDGYERFMYQMDEDYGGFDQYHVALFGEPGNGPFEWVLTGRHVTLRADGNSVEGAAFGGPIFYGHASHSFNEDPAHTDNVWWYQGEAANAIFKTLDEGQRKRGLVSKSETGDTPASIRLRGGEVESAPGLPVAELDSQQKVLVKDLLTKMLQPFRKVDAAEVRSCLEEAGGLDTLRLTYYQEGDIGDDGVWDIWKLEGPAFAWYFHGSPHVHTWLNVARKA